MEGREGPWQVFGQDMALAAVLRTVLGSKSSEKQGAGLRCCSSGQRRGAGACSSRAGKGWRFYSYLNTAPVASHDRLALGERRGEKG